MQEKSGWVKQAVPPTRHTGNLLNRGPASPAQAPLGNCSEDSGRSKPTATI